MVLLPHTANFTEQLMAKEEGELRSLRGGGWGKSSSQVGFRKKEVTNITVSSYISKSAVGFHRQDDLTSQNQDDYQYRGFGAASYKNSKMDAKENKDQKNLDILDYL